MSSFADTEQYIYRNAGIKSGNIPPPLPDYTRVDCGRPRIYPWVNPGLYPRGGSRSLPLPPRIHPPPFIVIM